MGTFAEPSYGTTPVEHREPTAENPVDDLERDRRRNLAEADRAILQQSKKTRRVIVFLLQSLGDEAHHPLSELKVVAKGCGIEWAVVRAAAKDLGLHSETISGAMCWRLPPMTGPAPLSE